MPYFYAYIRVSHPSQVESGLSLESQEARARAYFSYLAQTPGRENLRWGLVFAEKAVSAYKKQLIHRPVGGKMHERLREGDHVCFIKLDRGFRNTRDMLNTLPLWESRGITVHFLDPTVDLTTATGRMFLTITAAVAEWESAVKSERIKAAFAALRLRGQTPSGWIHPRGTQFIGARGRRKVIANWRDVAIGRLIHHLYEFRGMTYMEISDRVERILSKRDGRPYQRRAEPREWHYRRCNHTVLARRDLLGPERMERIEWRGKVHYRVLSKGEPVTDWYASRATAEIQAFMWAATKGIAWEPQPGVKIEDVPRC